MKNVFVVAFLALFSVQASSQEMPKYYKNYEKQKKQIDKRKYDVVFSQSSRKIKRATKDSLPLSSALSLIQLSHAITGDAMGVFFKNTDSLLLAGWNLLQSDTLLNNDLKISLAQDYTSYYFNRENYQQGLFFYQHVPNELPEKATTIDSLSFHTKQLKNWEAYLAQGFFYRYNSSLDTLIKIMAGNISDSVLVSFTDSSKTVEKPNGKIKKQKKALLSELVYLKAATFFEQGYFKEGERFINEWLKPIKKYAGKKEVYAKFIKLQADFATVNDQNKIARKTYKKAIKRYRRFYEKFDLPILEIEEQLVYNQMIAEKEVGIIDALETLSKHTMKWDKTTNFFHIPHIRATILAHDYLKQYKKAEGLTVQLINYQSETIPHAHRVAIKNNQLAYQYLLSRSYFELADTLSQRQTKNYAFAFGEGSPKHAISLVRRADYLTNYEFDLPTANRYLFGENWKNYTSTYSSWHPDLIPAKINRARLLAYGNKLDEATNELIEARKGNEDRFGVKNKQHATILLQWARLSLAKGEFEQAKDTIKVALSLFKELSGEKSLDYLLATQVLADYHIAKGNLYEAEILYNQIVASSKKIYQEIRLTSATDPESLAKLYISIGDLDQAEAMLLKSLASKEALFGENHISILNANYLMAEVQLKKGNVMRALRYGEKAVSIGENELSESKKIWLTAIKNTLAQVYVAIGDNEAAKKQWTDVFELQKEVLGNKHIELARTSLLLAEVDYALGNLTSKQCIRKLDQSAKAIKKSEAVEHPEYARALLISARHQLWQEEYLKAISDANEAAAIVIKTLGENSERLAEILQLQAEIYLAESKFDVALDLNKKANKIYEKLYDRNHYKVLKSKQFVVSVLWVKGEKEKALKAQQNIVRQYTDIISNYYIHLNKRERQIYQSQISEAFNDYYSMALASDKPEQYYANVLETKWIQKQFQNSRLSKLSYQVKAENDSLVGDLFENWKEAKVGQVLTLIIPKADQKVMGINKGDLRADVKQYEKQLRKKSTSFSTYQAGVSTSIKQLRKQLNDSTTAIEMIRFLPFGSKVDSAKYAVIQVSFNDKSLKGLIIEDGKSLETEQLRNIHDSTISNFENTLSYKAYWEKINELVKSYDHVYWAADGVFNWVNPEGWNCFGTSMIINDYQLIRINSMLEIGKEIDVMTPDSADVVTLIDFHSLDGDSTSNEIAAKHAVDVKTTWEQIAKNHHLKLIYLSDTNATEENVEKVKLGTVVQVNVLNYGKEPLTGVRTVHVNAINNNNLLAGLVFSNGSKLTEEIFPANVNKEKGVMTATELSTLDFTHTKLLVLANLETSGMSWEQLKNQNTLLVAAKQAGVSTILYTTKQIDENRSSLFLSAFYQEWLTKKTKPSDALYEVKKKLMKEQPAFIRDWNSFIILD